MTLDVVCEQDDNSRGRATLLSLVYCMTWQSPRFVWSHNYRHPCRVDGLLWKGGWIYEDLWSIIPWAPMEERKTPNLLVVSWRNQLKQESGSPLMLPGVTVTANMRPCICTMASNALDVRDTCHSSWVVRNMAAYEALYDIQAALVGSRLVPAICKVCHWTYTLLRCWLSFLA